MAENAPKPEIATTPETAPLADATRPPSGETAAAESAAVEDNSKRKGPRVCPVCGVTDIRPSRVRGVVDTVMSWFRYAPFRCRSCWSRFHSYGPEILEEQEEMRRNGRLPRR